MVNPIHEKLQVRVRKHSRMVQGRSLNVFLSASFPSPDRDEEFMKDTDSREISNAVVELARAIFSINGTLVFGGHPTITPLICSIADDAGITRRAGEPPSIIVYQSQIFSDRRTEEAERLARMNIVEERLVDAVPKDFTEKESVRVTRSLTKMRRKMVWSSEIHAAVAIGGMDGVVEEYRLVAPLDACRCYLVCGPGGAAKVLSTEFPVAPEDADPQLREALERGSRLYPLIMQMIIEDCRRAAEQ